MTTALTIGIASGALAQSAPTPASASASVPAPALAAAMALCAGVSPDDGPAEPAALQRLLRREPARVLGRACGALPNAVGSRWWALALMAAEAGNDTARRAAIQALVAAAGADLSAWPPDVRADWHLVAGRLAFDNGQRLTSRQHFEAARLALQQAGQTEDLRYYRTLVRLSHAQQSTQQLEEAAASQAEAVQRLAQLGMAQELERADLHNAQALLAYHRLDREGTLHHSREEIAIYRAHGQEDSPAVLHALGNIGGILSQQQHYAEAERTMLEGLALVDRHPDRAPSAQVGLLVNLAALNLTTGDYPRALQFAQRGVATARRHFGEASPRQLTSLVQEGKARTRLGRYAQAVADFEQATQLARGAGVTADPRHTVWISEGQADVFALLGDTDRFEQALATGLAASQGSADLRRWRGALLRSQGTWLARQQRWADAEQAFGESEAVFGATAQAAHAFTQEAQAARCSAQVRAGQPATACVRVQAGLPALDAAPPVARYRAQAALATWAEAEGRLDDAYGHRLQALAAAQRVGGPHPLWEALHALAGHQRRLGRRATATFLAGQSVQAVEALRAEANAISASHEGAFLLDKLDTYRQLASWLVEDGRVDEALATMRLLKAEELHQFMLRDGHTAQASRSPAPVPREQGLHAEWQRLQQERAHDEAALAAAARALLDAWASAEPAAIAALPRAARALPPPGLLRVSTVSNEQRLSLVLEATAGRQVLTLDWPRAARAAEISGLLSDIEAGRDPLTRLQGLYLRLGAPMVTAARRWRVRQVELHLDDLLRYVPLAALHDGQDFLGSRLTLLHRNAAGLLDRPVRLHATTAGVARQLQAFGATRGGEGLPALSHVSEELCGIVAGQVRPPGPGPDGCDAGGRGRGPWPGQAWLDDAFTAARLARTVSAQAAPARHLLHIGTHFTLRPGDVSRSWLQLGDGQRLTLRDLAALDFAGQHLVTLSACETAVGSRQSDGREVEGLASLVLRRGAGTVLASLWRVEDRSTSLLMTHFYRALRHQDPARALQTAQARLRQAHGGAWAAPRHWAGFVLAQR